MPERAHITSVEALEDFRASLIVYVSKARPALEEVGSEVLRMRMWLQNDQRTHWEGQVRRRTKELQIAQQAQFSARIANLRDGSDAENMAVMRAKRALEEAEAKLRRVKQWSRDFDSRIEPLAKQLDHLRNVLTLDMPHAAAYLAQTIKTLADYAGLALAEPPANPSQPSDPNAAGAETAAQSDASSPPASGNPPTTPGGQP